MGVYQYGKASLRFLCRHPPQLKYIRSCVRFPYVQVRLTPLQGFAYDQLKKFVTKFEEEGTAKGTSHFPSFDEAMQLVDRGGRGVEWAWVRKRNVHQYLSS